MAGMGGGDDGGQPPPILVLTLTADPRGPTNEWNCHLGPEEGHNALNGPWGSTITTFEVGGVLANIARHGYSLQSSMSFGLSSITGYESDVSTIAATRRTPTDKASLLVRSTTAHNSVIQHIFQRERAQRQDDGLSRGLQQGLQASQTQISTLNTRVEREVSELRSERALHEEQLRKNREELRSNREELQASLEELRGLRASLERERKERQEALAEKDRELAALRRGVMEGAGLLAASMSARVEQEARSAPHVAHAREPEPLVQVEDEPEGERLPVESTGEELPAIAVGDRRAGPEAQDEAATLAAHQQQEHQQQEADIDEPFRGHHAEAHAAQPRGGAGSGGTIVESDIAMEGSFWRDLDQVLVEPLPQNIYSTPVRRHQSVPNGNGPSLGGASASIRTCLAMNKPAKPSGPMPAGGGASAGFLGASRLPPSSWSGKPVMQEAGAAAHVFLGRTARQGARGASSPQGISSSQSLRAPTLGKHSFELKL